MNVCIYTGTVFRQATREHILQNSLGARWESDKIICQAMQEAFAGEIDVAVNKRVSELRSLFETKSGRRDAPPSIPNVKTKNGRNYHLKPGGQPIQAEPTYEIEDNPDGTTKITISMADGKQLAWAHSKIKKEHPDLVLPPISTEGAQRVTDYLDEPVCIPITLGGVSFFRGITKSVFNLLGVRNAETAQKPDFEALRRFVVKGEGDCADFVRWIPNELKFDLPTLGPIDHLISVWSDGGKVRGFVQLFGDLPYAIRFADGVDCDDFHYTYVVNPLRNSTPPESREFQFNAGILPLFEDCLKEPEPIIWATFQSRISRIMANYLRISTSGISTSEHVLKLFSSIFGENGDAIPTEKQIAEFLGKLSPDIRVAFQKLLETGEGD